jgi:hypothetical protein
MNRYWHYSYVIFHWLETLVLITAAYGTGIHHYAKSTVEKTSGVNLANNMSGNMAAAVNNANAKASAYRDSGFFVDVADIEHPRWQYMTIDKKLLTRWMEIFKQVNEGKL